LLNFHNQKDHLLSEKIFQHTRRKRCIFSIVFLSAPAEAAPVAQHEAIREAVFFLIISNKWFL